MAVSERKSGNMLERKETTEANNNPFTTHVLTATVRIATTKMVAGIQ